MAGGLLTNRGKLVVVDNGDGTGGLVTYGGTGTCPCCGANLKLIDCLPATDSGFTISAADAAGHEGKIFKGTNHGCYTIGDPTAAEASLVLDSWKDTCADCCVCVEEDQPSSVVVTFVIQFADLSTETVSVTLDYTGHCSFGFPTLPHTGFSHGGVDYDVAADILGSPCHWDIEFSIGGDGDAEYGTAKPGLDVTGDYSAYFFRDGGDVGYTGPVPISVTVA